MFGIEQKVEKAARKGAAFSAATVLALVGMAFLTTAGWIILSELHSALFAATVIGFIYVGAAAITLAVGLKNPQHTHAQPTGHVSADSDLTPLQLVVLSFLQGFEKGRQNDRPS